VPIICHRLSIIPLKKNYDHNGNLSEILNFSKSKVKQEEKKLTEFDKFGEKLKMMNFNPLDNDGLHCTNVGK